MRRSLQIKDGTQIELMYRNAFIPFELATSVSHFSLDLSARNWRFRMFSATYCGFLARLVQPWLPCQIRFYRLPLQLGAIRSVLLCRLEYLVLFRLIPRDPSSDGCLLYSCFLARCADTELAFQNPPNKSYFFTGPVALFPGHSYGD